MIYSKIKYKLFKLEQRLNIRDTEKETLQILYGMGVLQLHTLVF